MRLLYLSLKGALCLTDDLDDEKVPPYAILSHTWGADGEEVTFDDMRNGNGEEKNKFGYVKLNFCMEQARKDNIDYFWIDTCCINKSSESELSQAIRSMFRWYRNAVKCYVFLADVSSSKRYADSGNGSPWEKSFRSSRWFTRGWTLQELLAPATVEFFSRERRRLGSKAELVQVIHEITAIPLAALKGTSVLDFSVEERFAWAEKRQTKKAEDMVYCLFGIFDVQPHVKYGEGRESAMHRLKKKVGVTLTQLDKMIRTTYDDRRLNIERVSGMSLPLECCFINLGIVDHVRDIDTESDELSSYSLAARLKVEHPSQSHQISLSTLFEPRKQKDNTQLQPTRILIWGRAGMGKTTLCKKIIHEFYKNGLWKSLYDRVIWLPLRKLKRTASRNIVELFQTEFPCLGLGERSLETLSKIIEDERTLFLLDGLDEVSFALEQDSPGECVLHDLVSQSHVIITSRPHSTRMLDHKPPNLEVETIGFLPQQIEEYLQVAAGPYAEEIQSFIKENPLVQTLAAIPIQLDAICYVWDKKSFPRDNATMTTLYLMISQSLWKDTILRLEKTNDAGERIARQQLEHWSWRYFQKFVKAEVDFLQELGFRSLCAGILEFSAEYIDTLEASLQIPGHEIIQLLFLRASDSSVGADDRTLHFIHLTFQEFFAAQYFVSCWTSNKKLPLWEDTVSDKNSDQSVRYFTSEDFVRLNKYFDRYNIFWRFVVGLLQVEQETSHLDRFFHVLDGEPTDLIGLMHQQLVIACSSEVRTVKDELRRKIQKFETRFLHWAVCQARLTRKWTGGPSASLVWGAEYSNYILKKLLYEDETDLEVLKMLCDRSSISPNILAAVSRKLCEELDLYKRPSTIGILAQRKFPTFQGPFLMILISLLRNGDNMAQRKTLAILGRQTELSNEAVNVLIGLLQDSDPHIQHQAACILGQQKILSKFAVEKLLSLSQYLGKDISCVLRRSIPFCHGTIGDNINLLQGSDWSLASNAARILNRQTSFSGEAFDSLAKVLQNPDKNVQVRAMFALEGCTTLPDVVLEALVKLMQDLDEEIQIKAMRFLPRQAPLPNILVKGLVKTLQIPSSDVLIGVIRTLGELTLLPSVIVESLAQLLQHPSSDVRIEVIRTLGNRTTLPNVAVESLIKLLQDSDKRVRIRATSLLDKRFLLSGAVLESLVKLLLRDPDNDVRTNAIRNLNERTTLPTMIIESFAKLLQDPDEKIRRRVLDRYVCPFWTTPDPPPMPNVVVEILIELLHGSNKNLRTQAAYTFSGQNTLPDAVVETFIRLLQDPDKPCRSAVVRALGRQATLNSASVDALLRLLRDPNESFQDCVLDRLLKHREIQSIIPTLDSLALERIVKHWFKSGSVVCFVEGGCFCVRGAGQFNRTLLQQQQLELFRENWCKARDNLGLPSLASVWST